VIGISVKNILRKMKEDFLEGITYLSLAEYVFISVVNGLWVLGAYLIFTGAENPSRILEALAGMICWMLGFGLLAWLFHDENYKLLEGDRY
jgi:hypothetical protein